MRKKEQYSKFILLLFSLIVAGSVASCSRSASTPPAEEEPTQTPVIVVQRETVIVEVSGEAPSPEPPDPTAEPVSRFTDIQTTYYVYRELVWAYDHGYIESCGTVPEPIVMSVAESPTPEETTESSATPERSEAEAADKEVAPAPVP